MRRRRFRIAAVLAVVTLLAIVSAYAGLRLWAQSRIDFVEALATSCLDNVRQTAEGDPRGCAEVSSRLDLVSRVPGFDEQVDQLEIDLHYRAAIQALELATSVQPDFSTRRVAALEVLELGLGVRAPSRPDDCRGLIDYSEPEPEPEPTECRESFDVLNDAGAWSVLVAFRPDILDGSQWRATLDASTMVGDIDLSRELTATKSIERLSHASLVLRSENDLLAGLWNCFLGDTNTGRSLFEDAREHYIRLDSRAYRDVRSEARIADAICSGFADELAPNDTLLYTLRALHDGTGARELLNEASDGSPIGEWPYLAAWIIADPSVPDDEISRLLESGDQMDALDVPTEICTSPWSMLSPFASSPTGPWLSTSPEVLENAGLRLLDAARDLSSPLHHQAMARSAWALLVASAAESTRRGRLDAALATIERADEAAAFDASEIGQSIEFQRYSMRCSASVRLAAGDAVGALALLGGAPELAAAADSGQIEYLRALALARVGRYGAAYDAAVLAQRVAHRDLIEAAAWLRVAMAILTGRLVEPVPDLPAAPDHLVEAESSFEQLAWFRRALQQSPSAQRRERMQVATPNAIVPVSIRPPTAALPAFFFVAGSVVPDGADVEVWLDQLSAQLLPGHGRAIQSARAEAARWRGDEESAEVWLSRAAELNALISDTRTTWLAHQLGF